MNMNKLNNTRKVKRNIVKSLATLCLGLLSVCFTACDDDLDVTQAYPFTVEAMPVPKELTGLYAVFYRWTHALAAHFGQNRGKFFSSVSSRIRVRVLFPHMGHNIQCSFIILIYSNT